MDIAADRIGLTCEAPHRASGEVHVELGAASAVSPELRDAWRDLTGDAAEPNAFAELWFAEPSFAQLGGEGVRLLQARDEAGRLVGILPLAIAPKYGRLPVSTVQNWLHYHSFLGTPLIRAGRECAFWTAALRALDRDPWTRGFLHLTAIPENGPVHAGLVEAARSLGRPCHVVHRTARAMLQSDLGPEVYYEQTVRKKKRKELKRLAARLAEQGDVAYRRFGSGDDLGAWCDAFLALEGSGWKGRSGSALACTPATERFFRDVMAGAERGGRLELLRLDLEGRPLAMLANFLTPPGSYSFKIAFDEDYARFSPGVLIQIENLKLLDRGDIGWMDSCAVEDHPMINSLWGERRSIVRLSVPLAGPVRRATFRLCRLAEEGSAALRRMRGRRQPSSEAESHDDD